MSLTLQWFIVPPLVLGFYFVVWKSQSTLVAHELDENDPDGTAPRSHARRVISSFSFVDWSALTLATLYLVFLVVHTVASLWNPAITAAPSPPRGPEETASVAFIALATDASDQVPWASRVTYSIGGVKAGTFTPGQGVAEALEGCPPGEKQVEGRGCPVSPLRAVAETATPSIEASPPRRFGCNNFVAPEVPPGLSTTVIRPPEEERDCFSDYVVTLYLNDAHDVEWLDFALSGP